MLEAFFVGRAVAEVLNERLGAAFGDALANFGTWDAETRQQIRCARCRGLGTVAAAALGPGLDSQLTSWERAGSCFAAAAEAPWARGPHPLTARMLPAPPPRWRREFQEEVLQRAQREMLAASGVDATASSVSGSSGGDATSLGGSAVTADLPALVDDLRAEVAATRAVVQQLKQQQQQRSSVQ